MDANVIKFRIKTTLTSEEEKEMMDLVTLIEERYTDNMKRFESRFHTDYEFSTQWNFKVEVQEMISDASKNRPYLSLL